MATGTFFLLLTIGKQNKGNLCVSSQRINQSKEDCFLYFPEGQETLKSQNKSQFLLQSEM